MDWWLLSDPLLPFPLAPERQEGATSGPSKTSELLLDEGDGADEAG